MDHDGISIAVLGELDGLAGALGSVRELHIILGLEFWLEICEEAGIVKTRCCRDHEFLLVSGSGSCRRCRPLR